MNALQKTIMAVLLCLPGIGAMAQSDAVSRVANSNMATMLANIPVGREADFGFRSRTQFASCTAGKPIRVLTLSGSGPEEALILLNEWRVPVLFDNHSVLLLTVVQNGGHYEVADLGGALLAKELEAKTPNGTYAYMVRLFNAHADFITASDNPEPTESLSFFPLYSAELFVGNSRKMAAKPSYTRSDLTRLLSVN
jgi:hypothetical protein